MKKERVIVSETQHGPVATDAAGPDAESGEADDVSEYSEEAGGVDPAGEDAAPSSADAATAEDVSADDVTADDVAADDVPADDALAGEAGFGADEVEEKADDAREEFERELRMLPGDWYVVHSYAGYENRV